MRSSAALPLLILLLLLGTTMGGIPPVSSAQEMTPNGSDASTVIRISLQSNGDARWTVTTSFELESDNEIHAFERLAQDMRANDVTVLSVSPYRQVAAVAESSTGRSMSITNISREATRTPSEGKLTLRFTWTDFVQTEDGRLILGDVFETESGTWFPRLGVDQELIIEFPDRYSVRSSSHTLDNGTFHVVGPASFDPGEPSAVLDETIPPPTVTPNRNLGIAPVLGIGGVLVLIGVIGYLMYRKRYAGSEESVSAEFDEESLEAVSEKKRPLLSDEERITLMLQENGGRMKQVDIVTETEWSNAKVSQLLSEMAEEGMVEKLRLGRENLISLPDETPDEVE